MSRRLGAGFVFVAMSAVPSSAHHTVAYTFDVRRLVLLNGTVTSVDWKYPHVIYHLAVPGTNGTQIDWQVESRHPRGMQLDGVERDTIHVGDIVTMKVMLALDGSHHAATASILLADGRMFPVCTVTNNACPS